MREYLPYVVAVGSPILTGALYWWRSRVDHTAREEAVVTKAREAALEAQSVPIGILKGELAKREAELGEVRAQDHEERSQFIAALTAIKGSMEEMAKDLRAFREEERAGRAKLYERVDQVDDRLLVIETRLEKRNGT